MNPLLSLAIVISGLLVFLKLLYWVKTKTPHFVQFSKKRSTPYLQDDDIQILNQFSLDEHYKVVILRLEGNKQTFLLGPTQAIKLDNPKTQENEQAKLFPLKSYMDIDKK